MFWDDCQKKLLLLLECWYHAWLWSYLQLILVNFVLTF